MEIPKMVKITSSVLEEEDKKQEKLKNAFKLLVMLSIYVNECITIEEN